MRSPARFLIALTTAAALAFPLAACAADSRTTLQGPPRAGEEIAIFAGGCFWCMETHYEGLRGIHSVVSGYTGGPEKHPTYAEVGAGRTGHYEAIEIRYDPRAVRYEKLLDVFWRSIDPTQGDGQFCDRGAQYRSAIFWVGDAQRALAEESRRRIVAAKVLKRPIVTRILPAGPFYRAEEYHQDFWKKDPMRYHSYRAGCGRDDRLRALWGARAAKPSVH